MRLVALLFVVHAALLAFSQGASADTAPRDQFGNVLCHASDQINHDGSHRSHDDHSGKMSCCWLGCSMFAGTSAAPPASGEAVATAVAAPPAVFVSYANVLASVPETPRITRGPPAVL
ncbi:hypothetical protein D3218_01475 [Aureimonas flava]|uniref:DUF2946 domain-containing protein n=1 Tax=Aureimonas flava TaxID=2320271 RepID=A0A3A1WQX7_9HYPH|nr:hypothetical protein D3218_01475 [Aureimonas flava]